LIYSKDGGSDLKILRNSARDLQQRN